MRLKMNKTEENDIIVKENYVKILLKTPHEHNSLARVIANNEWDTYLAIRKLDDLYDHFVFWCRV